MSKVTVAAIRKYLKKTGSKFSMPIFFSEQHVIDALAKFEKLDEQTLISKITEANEPEIFRSEKRREKGDLCDFVKKLGCVVSWVEGEKTAKLWGWEHPEYSNEDLWEDAEDCAEAFMKLLMGKLADEFSMDLVPRSDMRDIRGALIWAIHHPTLVKEQAEKSLAVVEKIINA